MDLDYQPADFPQSCDSIVSLRNSRKSSNLSKATAFTRKLVEEKRPARDTVTIV